MARQPTAREFSRAYNACTTAYRNRLRRAGLKPGDPFDSAAPRLDISAIPGIVACWDASYAPATASSSGGFLPALGDRAGSGNGLTSAGTGDDRPVIVESARSVFRTDGGSGLRRFDAAADVGDALFDGGGMVVAVADAQPTATTAGVLTAKWSTDGWIIFRFAPAVGALESYASGGSVLNRFEFPIPAGSRFLLEIEWNSALPTSSPVVRVNGLAVTVVTATAGGPAAVNDTSATLCVGNRNWGTNQTPWVGSIGEVALFTVIPTLDERSAIRSDFMNHWQLA